MSKIEKFNRSEVKALREALNQELGQLAKKYGIEIKAGNASFDHTNVTFKVQASVIANGQVLTPEARDFNRLASLKGLGGYQLGDQIEIDGKVYTLTGWNRKAPKYPVQISIGGKSYRATVNHVLRGNKIS